MLTEGDSLDARAEAAGALWRLSSSHATAKAAVFKGGALPPLEEGEYYHADLIGLPVVTEQGEAIGTVADVMNYGATDLVEIERANGKKFMVPLTEQAVPEWNDERLVVNAAFAED